MMGWRVSESRIEARVTGPSLGVQWLGLRASTAAGAGSIPGLGTKIPQAARPKKKKMNKSDQELTAFGVGHMGIHCSAHSASVRV